MTEATLRPFFERYARAFEAYDADAIADRFAVPCLFVRDGATVAVATTAGVVESVRELFALHRAWDVQTIAPAAVVVVEEGPRHALVRVEWRLGRTRSKMSWSYATTYAVVPAEDDDWRIAAALTHDAPF